uniref:Uncharacterized protein n=1 Tax=Romanomermis culicivorax TaxID=13658 RepID=A0A915KNV8_ROMCU
MKGLSYLFITIQQTYENLRDKARRARRRIKKNNDWGGWYMSKLSVLQLCLAESHGAKKFFIEKGRSPLRMSEIN